MRPFSARIVRFAFATLALATVSASAASFQFAPPPDELRAAYKKSFQFGYLSVPENRSTPNSRTIRVAVVILKAENPASGAPPVFFLNGGPGGACTADGEQYPVFEGMRRNHDVVLIDQRGVGFSQPFLGYPASSLAITRLARNEFRRAGVDLSAYNTTENAADIEALRVALGYPRVIIFGNSYGSILAQEVLRSYGASVAAAVINGVCPAEDDFVEVYNRSTRHGLNALFRDIQRTGPARRAFPQFRLTYFKLLRRLHKRPIRIGTIKVTADSLQGRILGYLQTPQRLRTIPLLVTRIAEGKPTPWLVKQLTPRKSSPRNMSQGMYNSVVGASFNSPGWARRTARIDAQLTPEIFRRLLSPGSQRLIQTVQLWDVPYNPRATRDPLYSAIPTLVIDGEMEAQTPPGGGAVVASRLPRSFLLTFPRSGHASGFTSGPAMQAILQFIANPSRRPVYSLAPLRRNDFYLTPADETKAAALVEDNTPFLPTRPQ